ncbi:MAG: ABC transporter substrate-binding protein [Chloroherpetonaceae bacterium]|nr:ABC transporter substrate-binding protein [Chloroherpetonaceae bacterium]MDW8436883.1 ABC transporter substrate-binding protein [Chloroherpetonaceae bacterium]
MRPILSLLVFCFLFGCGRKDKSASETFSLLNGGIKRGGTFRTNLASDISNLDPPRVAKQAEILVAQQIYDQLIELDHATLKPIPELATRWDVSDDGLVYTFHLRGDVFFHDNPCFPNGKGKRLTANDVKFSLTMAVDARFQSLGAEFFTTCVLGAREFYEATIEALRNKAEPKVKEVAGFIVKDDSTFVVKLKEPYAPFLYHLATGFGSITCEEAARHYGKSLSRNPVGTGAFVFVKWEEDREIVLKRNPNYWGRDSLGNQLPYLDGVSFRFLKEATTQLLEFQKGNLDECVGIPQEFVAQVFDANGALKEPFSKYALKSCPELRIDYIGMLFVDSLFKNGKLRQAFSWAIDRVKIAKYVLKNQVAIPTGIVAQGIEGYDNRDATLVDYDVQKAKKLLAEAGYPDGRGLPELTLHSFVGAKYAYNKEVAEAAQAMLQDIGVKVNIVQSEYSTHLQQAYLGKLPFFIGSWGADYPEPETFLNLVYGGVVPKGKDEESYINLSRYSNPAFDKVFAEALKISDEKKRYALYKQAEKIALDDAAILVCYHRILRRLEQPYLRNYPINAMDRRDYREVWLDK